MPTNCIPGDEMDKFLETYNHPKVNQEESENWNRKIIPRGKLKQ